MPVITVDGLDITQLAISLKLMSVTGKTRYKAQSTHLLWGVDRGK